MPDAARVIGRVALHRPAEPCLSLWVAGTGCELKGIAVQWGHRTVDSAALIAPG